MADMERTAWIPPSDALELRSGIWNEKQASASGAVDVIEHPDEDVAFPQEALGFLTPAGRFYCTVLAFSFLWSAEDADAGHFRRHTSTSLREAFERKSQ